MAVLGPAAPWSVAPGPTTRQANRGVAAGRSGRGIRSWAILLLWAALSWSVPAIGQVSRESDVKAVYLFNFAQFVDWPAEAFPDADAPWIIGILGTDPFGRTIDNVVKDEIVRGRRIQVQRFQRVDDVKQCHILYIGSSEIRRLPQILAALAARPILTVSDLDQFVIQGGMIRFFTDQAKVRLRINNDAARASGLTISTKLLRIAEVVSMPRSD